MTDDKDSEGYGNYLYQDTKAVKTRPDCRSCGDPVKTVYFNGTPKYAQHCHECFAEVRYGKIPAAPRRRRRAL